MSRKQLRFVSVVVSLIIAGGFFFPTAMNYAKTPDDALKVVGYFFIAAYGLGAGLLGGASVACGWLGIMSTRPAIGRCGLILASLSLAVGCRWIFSTGFMKG